MNTISLSDETRLARTVSSALWAGWADAVGFISELVDEKGIRRRLAGGLLEKPVEWSRRIGGQYGVTMSLPAGCYSDDTQLRLAVSRAISSEGFDVESFANIELPIWPAYALGGGIASKKAAHNLARPGVTWFSNFYPGWESSGGNGVAMRIQPHVWAAADPQGVDFLIDVIRDGVTTHGHPRALVGACLHALALGHALMHGEVPDPGTWAKLVLQLRDAGELVRTQPELEAVWIPSFEQNANGSFTQAWAATIDECESALVVASQFVQSAVVGSDNTMDLYRNFATELELTEPPNRGNGLLTVVAALALAAVTKDAQEAALISARALGTDTDTIGTMAAGIAGATLESCPDVQDGAYLVSEAQRMTAISAGRSVDRFGYPDLIGWSPPRSSLDAVGLYGDQMALAGLGWLKPIAGSVDGHTKSAVWQWTTSDFGASFLVKRRPDLRSLPSNVMPLRRGRARSSADAKVVESVSSPQGSGRNRDTKSYQSGAGRYLVDDLLERLDHVGLAEEELGRVLIRMALQGTEGEMGSLAAALRGRIQLEQRRRHARAHQDGTRTRGAGD